MLQSVVYFAFTFVCLTLQNKFSSVSEIYHNTSFIYVYNIQKLRVLLQTRRLFIDIRDTQGDGLIW